MSNETQPNYYMDNSYTDPYTPDNTGNLLYFSPPNEETLLQLNFHSHRDTTFSLLNTELTRHDLLSQEPGTYTHNNQPPPHPNWHLLYPVPKTNSKENRPRTCIYLNRNTPLYSIAPKPSNKPLLMAATINVHLDYKPQLLTLVSLYNPSVTFSGIDLWKRWLGSTYYRGALTILATDANSHHKLWNPLSYNHAHPEAKQLIKISATKGFKMILSKGVPRPNVGKSCYRKTSTILHHTPKQSLVQPPTHPHKTHTRT
ncbi:hypothetical protein O181_039956 [Austropuccinia psidii MF-1]|uniref:Endonuclease/exonuclease/phosphatase domain-containing protein n=1 Tax=Austropuccinia psidii MF-1 TaxID=1389203 RepID=A0A9Q3DGW3_9BASI|nr:hypothetical protein [Austropuccinia psidii MF-1]